MGLRHNITTALTHNLIAAGDNITASNVNVANVHASSTVKVDIFINNSTNNYYIIKNVKLPAGAALNVDIPKKFDSSSSKDSLRIKLDSAIPVDVIIN